MIDDVEAFRAAWNAARAVEVTERPNATVQAALDRLAEGIVTRVAHGSTVEAALKPFFAVVGKSATTSDPASLGATIFRDGDRWLVDVRMGYASSVSAFGRADRMSLPPQLRWSYRQFGPFWRTGALLAFDATSLSDTGVRYSFHLAFLRRTKQGYAGAGTAKGFGNYNFEKNSKPRLVAEGHRVTVRSLDAPRSFFVTNADELLRRTETWDTSGLVARPVKVGLLDPDVRAVDEWLWAHRNGLLTGKRRLPAQPVVAENIRRGKGWVQLDLDGQTLRFALVLRGGRNVVTKVIPGP